MSPQGEVTTNLFKTGNLPSSEGGKWGWDTTKCPYQERPSPTHPFRTLGEQRFHCHRLLQEDDGPVHVTSVRGGRRGYGQLDTDTYGVGSPGISPGTGGYRVEEVFSLKGQGNRILGGTPGEFGSRHSSDPCVVED